MLCVGWKSEPLGLSERDLLATQVLVWHLSAGGRFLVPSGLWRFVVPSCTGCEHHVLYQCCTISEEQPKWKRCRKFLAMKDRNWHKSNGQKKKKIELLQFIDNVIRRSIVGQKKIQPSVLNLIIFLFYIPQYKS